MVNFCRPDYLQSSDAILVFQQINVGKCVRVILTVCLVCQTFIDPPKDGAQITRDDITCKITYCSVGESRRNWGCNALYCFIKILSRVTNQQLSSMEQSFLRVWEFISQPWYCLPFMDCEDSFPCWFVFITNKYIYVTT